MPETKQFTLRRSRQSHNCAIALLLFGVFMPMVLVAPALAQRLPLPPNEQEVVNNAIDRGVVYLKRTQQKNGTWPQLHVTVHGRHPVGYATLPGLTLLECGVAADDPIIQKTAQFLRSKVAWLD